jgi:hypothetical protein
VIATVPSAGDGQMKRPRSSRLPNRHMPRPYGPLAAELSDDLHCARMAILRIASASHPGHTQLGVAATIPVNRHDREE